VNDLRCVDDDQMIWEKKHNNYNNGEQDNESDQMSDRRAVSD
jgi:hypothetical protein